MVIFKADILHMMLFNILLILSNFCNNIRNAPLALIKYLGEIYMIRKMVFGVVGFLLVLQAQTAFSADTYRDFVREIEVGNFTKAENILKNNVKKWSSDDQDTAWFNTVFYNDNVSSTKAMQAAQLLYKYNVSRTNGDVVTALATKKSEELVRYLISIGIPIKHKNALYWAVENGYNDNLFQLLLEKGAEPNGEALRQTVRKKRWALVPLLANRLSEDDMSYRWTRAEYNNGKYANPYDPIESKTALMFAAEYGQLSIVRLLIEKGAKVNLRAEGGETAASLAYDNGEIEIYNYLKANGAIDFEQKQVVQQPTAPAPSSSTTNVYVQPSTPAPSSSSSSSTPSRNVGKEIADAFKPPLQSGTYSLSGTQEKISIAGIAKSGIITQTWQGKSYQGTYNIDGNRMTVQIRGYTFVFNITSETSFSGHNETWVRTGF